MKWKCFPIPDGDSRAKALVLENLATGAREHALSKRLLARFSNASGPMVLVAFESLDLDYPHLYKYATYRGGQSDPVGAEPFSWTDSPRWGLVEVLNKWLGTARDAVVLCENWLATCEEATRGAADGSWESRILCFGAKEVYHVLTNNDCGNGEAIEATLRESQYRCATGICSHCASLPPFDIPSESFFDDVVNSTEHIFVPALDEEGFLVWSPGGC
jgi:hypothetical protein